MRVLWIWKKLLLIWLSNLWFWICSSGHVGLVISKLVWPPCSDPSCYIVLFLLGFFFFFVVWFARLFFCWPCSVLVVELVFSAYFFGFVWLLGRFRVPVCLFLRFSSPFLFTKLDSIGEV